jgi:hypothetical protein
MLAAALLALGPPAVAVFPPVVRLDGPRAGCQLIVTGPGGTDLTPVAQVASDPPGVVTVEAGYIRPTGTGSTTLRVSAGGRVVTVPVTVSAGPPVRFRHEVLPALGVGGCNSGACHGTPSGKNGFRLSLRGEDPAADFRHLTRDRGGRRTHPDPFASLLLLKGLGRVPHDGGVRLAADAVPTAVIAAWLRAGCPADPPDLPPLVGLAVTPPAQMATGETEPSPQLAVTATFADGTSRDVTRLSVFAAGDLTVADTTLTGRVRFRRPGETVILVRYLDRLVSVRVGWVRPDPGFVWPNPPARTRFDEAVFAKLKQVGVAPAPLCTDSQFVRRAYLDAVGRLPTASEAAAFLANPDRDRLIDALLERPEFADWWALKWADVLRAGKATLGAKGASGFHLWLRDRFAGEARLDELATELLTAGGDTRTHPAAGFWRAARDPQGHGEAAAQLFLGGRIGCAKCHNHPFERWTQDDYHRLAAVFARVGTGRTADVPASRNVAAEAERVVVRHAGELTQPRTGKLLRPDVPGGGLPEVPPAADRRAAFAAWLVGSPQFARATANRVWFHLVGRGVVDPPDDLRDSNPPVNDALLDALADELRANRFALRPFVRAVMRSRAYQLAPGDDSRLFAAAVVKPLTAEQLLDAVCDVTGVPERFPGQPAGTRAVQLPDGAAGHPFLTAFGKPARELPCECERTTDGSLPQSLHLLAGNTLSGKLAGDNRVTRRLAAGATPAEALDELFLAAVSRKPTSGERDRLLRAAADPGGWADVLWAVLNSREFVLRH